VTVKRWILVGVAAFIVLIVILAVVSGGGKNAGSSAAASSPPAQASSSSAPPSPAAAAPSSAPVPAPAKSQAPVIIAKYSGSGIENTPPFTTPSDWHLSWWYSCTSFGQSGNFIVLEYDTDGSIDFSGASVNELGTGKGPVATYVYGDAGQHYLSVNSECAWQVDIVSG
jgi:hypothetical protein